MQAAVDRCFAGLRPGDLSRGLRVLCCSQAVQPPPELSGLWINLDASEEQQERLLGGEVLQEGELALLVCDVSDEEQLDVMDTLLDGLCDSERSFPAAMLPLRAAQVQGASLRDILMERGLLDLPFGSVIHGEPAGFALALAVRAANAKAQQDMQMWSNALARRGSLLVEKKCFELDVREMMWEYLPYELRLALPAVNYHVDSRDGKQFAGYSLKRKVGFGSPWPVHEVDPPPGQAVAAGGEVVLVIAKSKVEKSIPALQRLHQTWKVMQTLGQAWSHPNIARSYQIYHSPRRFYIRMEHFGTSSLHQALKSRDGGFNWLSPGSLRGIAVQLAEAVRHLHVGPRICHLDLKPENIGLVQDAQSMGGELTVKIASFECAVFQQPRELCVAKCGTFPFAAPEVMEGSPHAPYDGFSADAWSVGCVLFELTCGVGIIERSVLRVRLDPGRAPARGQSGGKPAEDGARKLREAFADVGLAQRILMDNSVPEAWRNLGTYGPAARGLLMVEPEQRWTMQKLVTKLDRLTSCGPSNSAWSETALVECDSTDSELP